MLAALLYFCLLTENARADISKRSCKRNFPHSALIRTSRVEPGWVNTCSCKRGYSISTFIYSLWNGMGIIAPPDIIIIIQELLDLNRSNNIYIIYILYTVKYRQYAPQLYKIDKRKSGGGGGRITGSSSGLPRIHPPPPLPPIVLHCVWAPPPHPPHQCPPSYSTVYELPPPPPPPVPPIVLHCVWAGHLPRSSPAAKQLSAPHRTPLCMSFAFVLIPAGWPSSS